MESLSHRDAPQFPRSDALINPAQQQHTAFRADVLTFEVGFDEASPKAAEFNPALCTLWPRQPSVVTGGQIPMTTRLDTRLPTS
jgi:hypothetical protein